MKNYFNIKNLMLFVLTFVCFFILNGKVEAVQCRYSSLGAPSITADAFENEYSKYQVEISNDSGNTQLSIYDRTNKKQISLSGNKAQLGGYTFQFAGSLSDISLGTSCPSALYYISSSIMTDINGNQSIPYKYYSNNILSTSECYDTSLTRCGQLSLDCTNCYGALNEAYDKCIKDGYGETVCKSFRECYAEKGAAYCKKWLECIKAGNTVSYCSKNRVASTGCVYASYEDVQDKRANENYFSIHLDNLTIPQGERVGDYTSMSMSISFSKDDLVKPTECPEILYLNQDGTQYSIDLYSKGKHSKRLGILKTSIIDHNGNNTFNTDDLCNKLEGTKTLDWIKKVYLLLRILVPTLIIVLSVVDFLGVVFSGDSEKMEKAKSKFIKRIVIGILFILIPAILELVLRLAGVIDSSLTEVVCRIIN